MTSEGKKFRVELAINLHAAPVSQTNPNMRIFPLQNALLDITEGADKAQPAWYTRLGFGDEISFRLVDISNQRAPSQEPDYPNLALAALYFNNPLTGLPTNPFVESVLNWRLSDRLDDRWSPVYSLDAEDIRPTWDLTARTLGGDDLKALRFARLIEADEGEDDSRRFRAFELTVVFKMRQDGWINHYVFDPEMIVSETDNEGDGDE